jgi:hypothetical protein
MRAERLADFSEIWCCDFEYEVDENNRQRPTCMVAVELHRRREIRLGGDELRSRRRAPFGVEPSQVCVAYSSPAELRCFLELGWPLPSTILDLYVEFRWLSNGRRVPAGYGLVGALTAFGLDSLDAAEKEDMRALALRGFPYTADERRSLLDYCASDVYALLWLLPAMEPYLDFPRAFLRGRYMRAVARMMQTGVPVDRDLLAYLRHRWEPIKANLIAAVDGPYGVYDRSSFRAARWLGWCQTHGVPWPRLQSGAPKLDRETFQTMADDFPEVRPIGELRAAMGQMTATNVIAGPDGRNRAWLAPFGTKTGRNAPSSTAISSGALCPCWKSWWWTGAGIWLSKNSLRRKPNASQLRGGGGSLVNSQPPQGKSPPKYPRKVGDLAGLKRRLWWGILQCTYVFEAEDMTMEMRLKAAHALSQLAMTFMKAVEVAGLEARVQCLEGLLEANTRDE